MDKRSKPRQLSNGAAATLATQPASSGSPPSATKKVSHVPCKFFRQGVCQAGDNCPFSHDQDSSNQMVCKYFQKGNCKFGTKCALAHITPDGRRIPKEKKRKEKDSFSNGSSGPSSGNTSTVGGGGQKTPAGPSILAGSGSTIPEPIPQSAPQLQSHKSPSLFAFSPPQPVGSPKSTSSSLGALGISLARPATTGHNSRSGSFHSSFVDRSSIFSSRSGSTTSRTAAIWADRPKNPLAFEGSAVIDDDDDDQDSFEEDLVPSSLSDLLTPQERERRNSRHLSSTSQRPDLFSTPLSSAGSASNVPTTQASTDLWGTPRFHRSSFGRNDQIRILDPIGKITPIGTPDKREV